MYEETIQKILNGEFDNDKQPNTPTTAWQQYTQNKPSKQPQEQNSFNEQFLGLSDDEFEKLSKQRKAQKQKSQKLEQDFLNLSDDELDRLLKQRAEQKANQTILPQQPNQNNTSKLQQNIYEEKAQDILDELKQTSKILPQGQQEPKEFDLAEQNTLANNYTNIYQQMQEQMKNNEELQAQYNDFQSLLDEKNKNAEDERAYEEYSKNFSKTPLVYQPAFAHFHTSIESLSKDEKDTYNYHQSKTQLSKDEFIRYRQNAKNNDKTFFNATQEQTDQYTTNNNLTSNFIKLYNDYALKDNFIGKQYENPSKFYHYYKNKMMKEQILPKLKTRHAQLENFYNTYQNTLPSLKAMIGSANEQDILALKKIKQSINHDLTEFMQSIGLELVYDENQKLLKGVDSKTGISYDLTDKEDDFFSTIQANQYEFYGGIFGTLFGLGIATKFIPNPIAQAGSALAFGVAGTMGGAGLDYLSNAFTLGKEVNMLTLSEKQLKAGVVDLAGAGIVSGVGKAGAFIFKNPKIINGISTAKAQVKDGIKSLSQKHLQSIFTEGRSVAEDDLYQIYFKNNPANKQALEELKDFYTQNKILPTHPNQIKEINFHMPNNIVDFLLKPIQRQTKEHIAKQNEIFIWAMSEPKFAGHIANMLKHNPRIHEKMINIVSNVNKSLVEPLEKYLKGINIKSQDDKVAKDLQMLFANEFVTLTKKSEVALSKRYADLMENATKVATENNILYDTNKIYDDFFNIINSYPYAPQTKIKNDFLDFLNAQTIFEGKKGSLEPINPNHLNNLNIALSNYYPLIDYKDKASMDIWKALKDNIAKHNDEYFKTLNKHRKDMGEKSFDEEYVNVRKAYHNYKQFVENDLFSATTKASRGGMEKAKNIVDEHEEAAKFISFEDSFKNADFNNEEVINALNKRLENILPEHQEEYEMNLIASIIARHKLIDEFNPKLDMLFIDKVNALNTIKEYNFKSPKAKEYVKIFDKVNKIFNQDETLLRLKAFSYAEKKKGGSIATSPFGALMMMFVNNTKENFRKYTALEPIDSLKYQVFKAVLNSDNLADYSAKLTKLANNMDDMPLMSKNIIQTLAKETKDLHQMTELISKGEFGKAMQMGFFTTELDNTIINQAKDESFYITPNNNLDDDKVDNWSKPIVYDKDTTSYYKAYKAVELRLTNMQKYAPANMELLLTTLPDKTKVYCRVLGNKNFNIYLKQDNEEKMLLEDTDIENISLPRIENLLKN